MNREEIMLIITSFLVPEVEEEEEVESSHASHVWKEWTQDIMNVQTRKKRHGGEAHITEAQRRDVEAEDAEGGRSLDDA